MSHVQAAPAPWADADTLAAVRPEVRALLERSEGFRRLPLEEQRGLAATMVKVAAYMANPDGLAREELGPGGGLLARAQEEDPVEATKRRLSEKQGFAGEDFEAGALRQGTDAFGDLVTKVDFPKFVGGLIQNVFQAIVDASMQQMAAYGELLANVAKTVDQFARDNISENNARDWLSDRYPDALGIDEESMSSSFAEGEAPQPSPQLTVTAEDGEGALVRISNDLGLAKPITDISDPAQEQRLVQAARLEIARGRQQLLASMVLLGINRIVVTDGTINAKVMFSLHASDQAQRTSAASMYDRKASRASSSSFRGSFSPWSGISGGYSSSGSEHKTAVSSSVEETSESKAELKAKLSGEVRVNFKSDYLPLEKMATPQMIAAISGNAEPRTPAGVAPAAPAGAGAAPAAPAPAAPAPAA
jgi:hypothetical protein